MQCMQCSCLLFAKPYKLVSFVLLCSDDSHPENFGVFNFRFYFFQLFAMFLVYLPMP